MYGIYHQNGQDELMHYGVKGMKWGVRRKARKDAKEYARAKMFYGEGAGTRRKLIKATVNERSKDPGYKKAFDEALSKQDMSKHASKAKTERKIKDTKNTVAKTGRGVVNIVSGHPERVGATLTVAAAAYGVAHKAGVDKVIANAAKVKFNDIASNAQRMKQVWEVKQKMRKWGVG